MKKRTLLVGIITTLTLSLNAQSKKQLDQFAIKKMCGCYEVGFNFSETFQYSENPDYKPSETKHSKGLEWVELIEDSENKIAMQHLLIVGPPQKQKVIKHWRQDWLFENTELYQFHANNRWNYVNLPKETVKGQWTQKVYQVDDSPRYEGTASWVHVDGQSSWENTADAPLPRREYTKRDDYNVTIRTNKHLITNSGWVHDQDNKKVIRKQGASDFILAEEKGYNTYTKVDDSKCKVATDWWVANADSWALVRAKWEELFGLKKDLILEAKIDDKPLFGHLLNDSFEFTDESVSETIDLFVVKK